jgi:stearoyl-CoA desaturase (delta-9 desaturase)
VRALPVSRGRQGFLPLAGGPDDAGPFPWERPWWLPTRGGWPTLGYLVLIHVTAVVGLIVAPWPGWQVLVATLVMAWLGGMGTTICYHRAIAHRSVRLNPIVRNILTFFAMLNGSGAPLSWAAYHRHHHATSDTSRDISSPRLGGFWWSHLRWLWQGGPAPQEHYCRDLDSFSYRFWGKVQIPVLALSYFGPLVFGWPAFFWMGSIRLVYSLHGQCFVNSVCHLGPLCEEKDSSKNVWWLSLAHLFQGENWHGNHHERPGSARFGWKPWQIDFGWWTILLLERLRLAKNIRVQIPSKG